jgi:hypothetical protein
MPGGKPGGLNPGGGPGIPGGANGIGGRASDGMPTSAKNETIQKFSTGNIRIEHTWGHHTHSATCWHTAAGPDRKLLVFNQNGVEARN